MEIEVSMRSPTKRNRLGFDDGAFLDQRLERAAGFGLHPVAGDDGGAEAREPDLARGRDGGFADAIGLKGWESISA